MSALGPQNGATSGTMQVSKSASALARRCVLSGSGNLFVTTLAALGAFTSFTALARFCAPRLIEHGAKTFVRVARMLRGRSGVDERSQMVVRRRGGRGGHEGAAGKFGGDSTKRIGLWRRIGALGWSSCRPCLARYEGREHALENVVI